ncbi:MAG TPA: hypothetical protein VK054_13650 [Beutenbergiaceae bacterium]|nr:hypothetical protein [Beutenbergiaceae bacterium]
MKASIARIQAAHAVLQQIGEQEEVPVRGRYRIYQLSREFMQVLEAADQLRDQLLEEFAEKDQDGQPKYISTEDGGVEVTLTDPVAFRERIAELMSTEEEVEGQPLRASELGEAIAKISPAQLVTLGPFFEWDEEPR